jgi:triacylglycerol lipase
MPKGFGSVPRSPIAGLALMVSFVVASMAFAQEVAMNGKRTAFTFNAGGNSVACLKVGSGSPLIIVHGLGGHKEDFLAVMDELAPRHTVYACDMLGFGQSSRNAPSVGIGAQAEVIKALADTEKLARPAVAGNSLGGWVAATFAAKYPERIAKLILIDAAGLKVTLSGPPPVNFAPGTVDEMQKLLQTVIASPFAHGKEFAAKALADFKASGEAETLGKLFAGFANPDSKDRVLDEVLPDVKAPTLVIWGAKDGLFPVALADVVAGGVKGSQKMILANASHFSQIDDPKGLSSAIQAFLQ